MAKVQAHIDKQYPDLDIEFVKGGGYFYYAGMDGHMLDSIMIYALCHMSLEQWTAYVDADILAYTDPLAQLGL